MSARDRLLQTQSSIDAQHDELIRANRHAGEGLQTVEQALAQIMEDGDVLSDVGVSLDEIMDEASLSSKILGNMLAREKGFRLVLFILTGINFVVLIVGIAYAAYNKTHA